MKASKEERRRLVQEERLRKLSDRELRQVGVELYNRAEQFGSVTRQVVNDELRRRGMQTVQASTGEEVDYG